MSNVTINILELSSELAHKDLIKQVDSEDQLYEVDEESGDLTYKPEYQEQFFDLVDMYEEIILSCKSDEQSESWKSH